MWCVCVCVYSMHCKEKKNTAGNKENLSWMEHNGHQDFSSSPIVVVVVVVVKGNEKFIIFFFAFKLLNLIVVHFQ